MKINQERLLQVILAPHITEKSTLIESANQHVFKVRMDATKLEVKQSIELLYSVKVLRVNVLRMKPIKKKTAKGMGYTKAWKKAYVTLREGETLDSYLVS